MSRVGRNIDAFCSRCGFVLAHVILYEVDGAVQGVKCRTCGAEHRYRGPAPKEGRVVPAVRSVGSDPSASRPKMVRPADARLWEARNAEVGPDPVVWGYKWTEGYEKGDIIDHPRFGRGFVESVLAEEMEVLFREGRKRLAMNRTAAAS